MNLFINSEFYDISVVKLQSDLCIFPQRENGNKTRCIYCSHKCRDLGHGSNIPIQTCTNWRLSSAIDNY